MSLEARASRVPPESSPPLKLKHRLVIRFRRRTTDGHHGAGARAKREAVALQQMRKNDLRLCQREVQPNADARTDTERNIAGDLHPRR